MSLLDRTVRSLFVALAVGLGWGIRGDFGHLLGAMYPGAALALGLAFVSGQRSLFLWMPIIAALSALGIGAGGSMSYGILHGYAYGESIVGAETTPLLAYLVGFAVIQYGLIAGGIIGLDKLASKSEATRLLVARVSGLAALLTSGAFLAMGVV